MKTNWKKIALTNLIQNIESLKYKITKCGFQNRKKHIALSVLLQIHFCRVFILNFLCFDSFVLILMVIILRSPTSRKQSNLVLMLKRSYNPLEYLHIKYNFHFYAPLVYYTVRYRIYDFFPPSVPTFDRQPLCKSQIGSANVFH